MDHIFCHIKNTIFIILGSAILAVFTYSAIAFTEPTQSPPQGNVPPPINIGSTAQTKSGSLTINNAFTVGGAGTFAQLCLGGSCRSLWSDIFNPAADYSGSGLRAASVSTANYANSAGTANTLQGYTVGNGASQIPVTDSGGRLSSGVMPAGVVTNACNFFPPSANCPSGTYQHSSWRDKYTSDFWLDVLNSRPDFPKTADQCANVKWCFDRGGEVNNVGSLSYDPYSRDDYYNPRNNCAYVPPSKTSWEGKWSGAWRCYIPLKLCCPNP